MRQLLLALLLALAAPVAMASQRPVQRLRDRIVKAVHTVDPAAQVSIGSLKAYQSMAPCPTRPHLFLYGTGPERDMRVSCPARGWQLYVSVRIQRRVHVLVASRDLTAGTRIERNDLTERSMDQGEGSSGLAHDPQAVIGHRIITPVGAGQPIYLADVRHRVRVHAGQEVVIQVQAGPVHIKVPAVAMQNGVAGQSILVRNASTQRVFRVEVTHNGVIDDLSG